MFTGIVEQIGIVTEIVPLGSNISFCIESSISSELKVDQSVAHDGVCLTVEEIKENTHKMTAIAETLEKTTLGKWQKGRRVNLERSLLLNSRLDGHFVQGHVDTTATCQKIKERNGSFELEFRFAKKWAPLVIEKGSITINGTSLTVFDVKKQSFRVAIIPYTWEHTSFNTVQKGDLVNIEFDMLGKYVHRLMELKHGND